VVWNGTSEHRGLLRRLRGLPRSELVSYMVLRPWQESADAGIPSLEVGPERFGYGPVPLVDYHAGLQQPAELLDGGSEVPFTCPGPDVYPLDPTEPLLLGIPDPS